jgi:hypothetical protein
VVKAALQQERQRLSPAQQVIEANIGKQMSWQTLTGFLKVDRTMLPSYTSQKDRANNSRPLNIYKLLFMNEKKILKADFYNLNISTIIFIDPKDELISFKKLIRFVKRFRLTNYKIIVLDNKLPDRVTESHHLPLNKKNMGKKNRQMFTEEMSAFLF